MDSRYNQALLMLLRNFINTQQYNLTIDEICSTCCTKNDSHTRHWLQSLLSVRLESSPILKPDAHQVMFSSVAFIHLKS